MPALLRRRRGASAVTLALVLVGFGLSACSSSSKKAAATNGGASAVAQPVDQGTHTDRTSRDGRLTVETTSSRAAFVSGGTVLVTVSGPALSGATAVHVARNGADVTSAF